MSSHGQSKEEENQSLLVKSKDEALSQSVSQTTRSENSLKDEFSLLHELGLLLHIALPSVCVQFNMYFLYPQGASAVGLNLGTDALAGFSLGSLVGNLTCQSIMIGALSAADTLMPRAFASQRYAELGRLAVRAVAVSSVLLLPPVVILCTYTDWILVKLGQDEVAASFAASWIRVYLLGLPANLVFRVSQRFLISQHRPWPPVYASIVPSFVIQPILLRVLLPIMGFEGSALAIVISQWAMLLCLFFYLHYRPVHHPQSWPGLSWSFVMQAFLPEQFCRFFNLSLGGVVSLVSPGALDLNIDMDGLRCSHFSARKTSDVPVGMVVLVRPGPVVFYRRSNLHVHNAIIINFLAHVAIHLLLKRETMCFVAGTFGVVPLCVHTIAYNLIPLLFMIPLGIGLGLAVRMGNVLATDPGRAKLLATWCVVFISLIALVVALLLFALRNTIISLFSKDVDVIQGCLDIWMKVSFYIFIIFIFGINSAIMRALGMQWTMAVIMFLCLWCGTLPSVVYFAMKRGGGLSAEWLILPCGYTIMQFILMTSYALVNWEAISHDAKESLDRAMADSIRHYVQQLDAFAPTEETPLLT